MFGLHFRNDLKTNKLIHNSDKVKTLMARWRFPSLSLHGIQGAFSEPGSKTVIPRKVIGKRLTNMELNCSKTFSMSI